MDRKRVIAQYEAIRRLGQTNMFDVRMVELIAYHNGFYELVEAIEEGRYPEILVNYGKWIEEVSEDEIPEAKPIEPVWRLRERCPS